MTLVSGISSSSLVRRIEMSTTTIVTLTDLSRFLPVSGAKPSGSLSMLHFVLGGAVVVYTLWTIA